MSFPSSVRNRKLFGAGFTGASGVRHLSRGKYVDPVGLLLERHGSAGKTVIPLEFSVPAWPVIGDPLLRTFDRGSAGRAWAFLHSGRPSRLVVKAKGEWTVRVHDLGSASPLDGSMTLALPRGNTCST
jgi:hypothetical protein